MIDPEILRQVRRIQVRTSRLVTDVMSGGYSSVFRGSGIEFDEVREYCEGDDPRSVDWNVTARTGRPYVKKFVEERELTVVFLLDVSLSMQAGFGQISARQAAAQFCACLALSAIRNNDKVGFVAFRERVVRYVPAKKGVGHVLRIVRDCLAIDGAPGENSTVARGWFRRHPHATVTKTDFVPALEFAGRVLRRRAVVFLVSDFLNQHDYDHALRIVARRHDVIAARIRVPELSIASNPRARGLLRLRDLESGGERLVDFSSREVRDHYAMNVSHWSRALDDRLRRARIDSMEIDLSDFRGGSAIVDPILQFFRKREMRAARA